MNNSSSQFGLLVAYLLPGFIGLAGLAPFVPLVAAWLVPLNQSQASLGAPLYAVLAATTVGMIVSCFRWILIDHLHQWTGLKSPIWDDNRLVDRLGAFNYLVNHHYRHYQFQSNTLVAAIFAYLVNRAAGTSPTLGPATDVAFFIVSAALVVSSRDSLSKYYKRTSRLIGPLTEKAANHDQWESSGQRRQQ